LHAETQALLALAQAEDWDALPAAMARYQVAQSNWMQTEVTVLDEQSRALMEDLQRMNEELAARLTAGRASVLAALEEVRHTQRNGQRLSRAYGV
jgi:hypothetical protein